jgi:altronate hydrolase
MEREKRPTLRLHESDNVVVARGDLPAGIEIPQEKITSEEFVAFGHKVAVRRIQKGDAVLKYGQIIGSASRDIKPGQHVHTHNLEMKDFKRDYEIGAEARNSGHVSKTATFNGIVRSDGRTATRNYIGVVSTVNCSASVSRFIADAGRQQHRPSEKRAGHRPNSV